jgi:pyruvate/2-oxoglutarate dehydrogenase complex dihydrolipoamide acyltransferase (E2) component
MRMLASTFKMKPDFVVDRRGRVRTSAAVQAGVLKAGAAKAAATIAAGSVLVLTGTAHEVGEQAAAVAQAAKAGLNDLIQRRSPGLRGRVSLADSKKTVRVRPVYRPKPRPKAPLPNSLQALLPPPPAAPIRFDAGEIPTGPMLVQAIVPAYPPPEECLCNWAYVPPSAFGGT